MISEEELTRRVREKLEDTDAITRLGNVLRNLSGLVSGLQNEG